MKINALVCRLILCIKFVWFNLSTEQFRIDDNGLHKYFIHVGKIYLRILDRSLNNSVVAGTYRFDLSTI